MDEKIQLLELVRQAAKSRSLSRKTVNAYLNHIRRFLEFNGKGDLSKAGTGDVRAFLNHLETNKHFAASTQNQALCALTFLYRDVFGLERDSLFGQIRSIRPPVKSLFILTPKEAKAVLSHLEGASFLAAALMYGAGLRLAEAVRLRVGDLDFERGEITVRDVSSGAKDRASILPKSIVAALRKHLDTVRFLHEDDCLRGCGAARLPNALRKKYANVERQWRWQYVFPACKLTADESGAIWRRHHLAESTVQKAINGAIEKTHIAKKVCCQTLRYSFAKRLFEKNTNVHTIHNLLGHKNLKTTLSYINSFECAGRTVQSPLDY